MSIGNVVFAQYDVSKVADGHFLYVLFVTEAIRNTEKLQRHGSSDYLCS